MNHSSATHPPLIHSRLMTSLQTPTVWIQQVVEMLDCMDSWVRRGRGGEGERQTDVETGLGQRLFMWWIGCQL